MPLHTCSRVAKSPSHIDVEAELLGSKPLPWPRPWHLPFTLRAPSPFDMVLSVSSRDGQLPQSTDWVSWNPLCLRQCLACRKQSEPLCPEKEVQLVQLGVWALLHLTAAHLPRWMPGTPDTPATAGSTNTHTSLQACAQAVTPPQHTLPVTACRPPPTQVLQGPAQTPPPASPWIYQLPCSHLTAPTPKHLLSLSGSLG